VPTFPTRDNQELHYKELGEGRPLVLLHGYLGSAEQWLEHGHAEQLAAENRVILPDLRAHGENPRPHAPSAYPPDALVDDGFALIDHLGLADYNLGGYSLGARVVARMLAKGAKPAKAIVAGQGLKAVNGTYHGANRRILTAILSGKPLDPADEEQAHWFRLSGNDPTAMLNVLNTLIPTPDKALAQIETPTLVAIGTEDQAHASAPELAQVLPNGHFTQIPGNHFTAMTNLAPAITAFLA